MIPLPFTITLLGAAAALALVGAAIAVVAVLAGLAVAIEGFVLAGEIAGWGG